MEKADRRRRERRRKKRKLYGQMRMKHSKRGIISCIMAGVSLALNIGVIVIAYHSSGKTAAYIGGFGVMAVLLSGTGIYMAVRGLKERNRQKITCKIGMAVNCVLMIGLLGIFCRGLF